MRTTRGAPDGARGSRPPPSHRGARADGPADPWPPPRPSPRARGELRGMRDDRVVYDPDDLNDAALAKPLECLERANRELSGSPKLSSLCYAETRSSTSGSTLGS